MDLISIAQTVWRHKLAVIPVILLTALAGLYVVKLKPPTYEASASFLLESPVGPTNAQIASNPGLQKISPSNPYLSLGGNVATDVVISLVTSGSVQQALVKEGADPRYQVTPSPLYGSPPIIDITGIGSTPQEAILTANLVEKAAENQLYLMQKRVGASDWWLITPYALTTPGAASRTVTGKLRTLVTVLALGLIMVFVAISAAEAIQKRRSRGSTDDNTALRAQPNGRTGLGRYREGRRPYLDGETHHVPSPRPSGSGKR